MDKYIIWGCGVRGKAAAYFIGIDKVQAFIDSDIEKQKKRFLGKEVISFEKYKQDYRGMFVVISMCWYKNAVMKLRDSDIYTYFLLSDCPQEAYGNGKCDILDNLPFTFDISLINIIWGINLFSISLFDKLKEEGAKELYIVPHPNMELEQKEEIKRIYKDNFREEIFAEGMANLFVAHDLQEEIYEKKYHIYNINDFTYQCEEYHNLQIEALPKCAGNQRCFIIGTGPSLRIEDLDKLWSANDICISMNKIFYSFDKTVWRPDYYLVEDKILLGQNLQTIKNLHLKNMLIADSFCEEFDGDVIRYHSGFTDVADGNIRFSRDASRVLYQGTTVTYTCIQFAVYLGFKEIYLLGVDCNFGKMGEKGNHFYEEEDLKNNIWPKEINIKAYETAKKYAEKNNIIIKNATRGGRLEVFDRVDFDSLF